MAKGERYVVECQELILQDYQHVDFSRLNAITRPMYSELRKAIGDGKGSYRLDDMMVAMAMLVLRMGFEMDKDNSNQNNWTKDGFPEFCSLIGPNSGFGPANEVPITEEKSNDDQ